MTPDEMPTREQIAKTIQVTLHPWIESHPELQPTSANFVVADAVLALFESNNRDNT